jgi:hypothetical protein
MVILQKKLKKICKGIFDALLANQIRLTYGDFEKYLKIYEIAMKNGNFIIFFWANFGKNVFYYGEQGDLHGYGQKGRFFKNMLFFSSRYMYIFCFSLRKECGFCFFFLMSFFFFTRVSFKKQQKKLNPHSKVNSAKDEGLGACAQTRVRRRIFSVFP